MLLAMSQERTEDSTASCNGTLVCSQCNSENCWHQLQQPQSKTLEWAPTQQVHIFSPFIFEIPRNVTLEINSRQQNCKSSKQHTWDLTLCLPFHFSFWDSQSHFPYWVLRATRCTHVQNKCKRIIPSFKNTSVLSQNCIKYAHIWQLRYLSPNKLVWELLNRRWWKNS